MTQNIFFITILCLLAACSPQNKQQKPEIAPIVVKTVTIEKPKPIIPELQPLNPRKVEWQVVTKDNMVDKIEENSAYYALNQDNYNNLILNMGDIRSYIEAQKVIIFKYKNN